MKHVKTEKNIRPGTIDASMQQLHQKQVTAITLGGRRFFSSTPSQEDKLQAIEKLAAAIQTTKTLRELTCNTYSGDTDAAIQLGVVFATKIMAAIQHCPIAQLSVDALALDILLKYIETYVVLEKLSIACQANSLSDFASRWKRIALPVSLSELIITDAHFFEFHSSEQTAVDVSKITDSLCDLIESSLKLKKLRIRLGVVLDSAFFEKLARSLGTSVHRLEIIFDCHVAEDAIQKIIKILDNNRKMQIHCTKGKEDYSLLYSVVQVANVRNGSSQSQSSRSKPAFIADSEYWDDERFMNHMPQISDDVEEKTGSSNAQKRKLPEEKIIKNARPGTSMHAFLAVKTEPASATGKADGLEPHF